MPGLKPVSGETVVNVHLKNIYESGELTRDATVRKYLTVQIEGDREVSRTLWCYAPSSLKNPLGFLKLRLPLAGHASLIAPGGAQTQVLRTFLHLTPSRPFHSRTSLA
ncbi:hypothetical protein MchiMG62_19760 [Methanoculleus chikugoensis]|uniref:Uncharacterized protein n=1 Tax=Methanoculleus chikugoensis TaxID=118126 RepID=A0ABM7H812_9EURY|nr:hypothetical protein MchiMG62_19760 [Methanoculleus chikugoensis]